MPCAYYMWLHFVCAFFVSCRFYRICMSLSLSMLLFFVRFLSVCFPCFFLSDRVPGSGVQFRLSYDHGWIRSGSVNVR